MASSDDIASRLESSGAVASLRQEQQIVEILQKLWGRVRHGSFYRDPLTSKLREIDVVARTSRSKSTRGRSQSVSVEIICELKSLRGFHLIFAPYSGYHGWDMAHREWFGFHDKRLAQTLAAAGATPEITENLLAYFQRACFVPGDERGRPFRLFINPPDPEVRSSAFRETNLGSDKDLDNSVLWRGIQAVGSALESSRDRVVANVLMDIAASIEYARHTRLKTAVAMAQTDIDIAAGHVEVFHPVVIVDACLWYSATKLREIQSCRFYRIGPDYPDMWFDVVALSAAEQYFKRLVAYYNREARKRRAR